MKLRLAIVKRIAALAALASALGLATAAPAMADGMPAMKPVTHKAKVVVHHRPRYHTTHTYVRGPWPGGPDPYSYAYGKQGYYPYYNSRLWVPRKQMAHRSRYPFRLPGYHSSWGYPQACKMQGHRACGVPFRSKAGDPGHYYRRDVQLPVRSAYRWRHH